MTQNIEVDLGKILERIEQNLIDLKVGQARLEGKIETLDVKIETLQKGQTKLETELKETRREIKDTRNDVSGLYKWIVGTLVIAVIGAANIFLKFFDLLLPKA